jgi:hypothetical protein
MACRGENGKRPQAQHRALRSFVDSEAYSAQPEVLPGSAPLRESLGSLAEAVLRRDLTPVENSQQSCPFSVRFPLSWRS